MIAGFDVAGIVRPETLRTHAADLAAFPGVLIVAPEVRYDAILAAAPRARMLWPYLRTDVLPGQGPRSDFYNALRASVPEEHRLGVDGADWFFSRDLSVLEAYLHSWQELLTQLSGWPWVSGGHIFLDQAFTVLPAHQYPYSEQRWDAGLAFTLSMLARVFAYRVVGNVGGAYTCPSPLLAGACMERQHVLALGAPATVARFRALAELGMRQNVIFDLAIRAPGVVMSGFSRL